MQAPIQNVLPTRVGDHRSKEHKLKKKNVKRIIYYFFDSDFFTGRKHIFLGYPKFSSQYMNSIKRY